MLFNKKKEYKEKTVKEPSNFTKTMVLVEPMCQKLLNNNLGKYLETDFVINNPYRSIKYNNKKEAEDFYLPYLVDILKYLNLPINVNLRINFVDENKFAKEAGRYQSSIVSKTITINISKNYSLINVLAIMSHECTHYFMEYNKLNWKDTELNEERTDMMTCIIGFSDVLINGYKIVEDVERHINYITTTRTKIGYISSEECKEIKDYLNYQRRKMLAERENQKNIELQRAKLHELISLINQFNNQINSINPINNKEKYAFIDSKQFIILKSALDDIAALNTLSVISELQCVENNSKCYSEIVAAINKANVQCEKLLVIVTKLNTISSEC